MSYILKIAALISALAPRVVCAESMSFEDRVRAYLMENPEIILEALTVLSEREAEVAMRNRVDQHPELFGENIELGMGDMDAPIKVIEFFDYRCIPCKAVHPVLEELVKNNENIRIEMRRLPILTPGSERAARFALATQAAFGDEAYGRVHERLWNIRGVMNSSSFEQISIGEGLDFAKIEVLMDSAVVSERIAYNRDVAIALEILGTPAFVSTDNVAFGTTDIDRLAESWLSQ